MRPFLCLLTLTTVTVSAEPAGSAQLLIERGLLQQRHLHHPAHALALFREALTAPDRTPRTTAEALWHMSSAYAHRGAEGVSLLLLSRIQHDCPGIEPFTRLAAAESIAISTGDTGISRQRDEPNAMDLIAARDTVWLLEAAVRLQHEPAVAALTRELRWHCDSMVFELSMGETTESADERSSRMEALETCQEWVTWARQSTPPALSDPAAAEIRDPDFFSGDPMLAKIFGARDAFTAAIAGKDAAAAVTARDSLQALVTPVIAGPEDLLIVRGFRGELAAMARSVALLEKDQAPAALAAWAEARRVLHEAGAGTSGFRVDDMDGLPESLLPEIMGALTFVESAITDLINDDADGISSAQASLETAIERLGAVAAKCREPGGQKRLEKAIRRLHEAGEKLEQGDTDGADTLMRSELYFSL